MNVAAESTDAADPQTDQGKRDLRRSVRFAQRQVLWQVSGRESVRKCGRARISTDGRVALKRSEDGRAHFSDLHTCGSIWLCPVCSGKVRNRRADEISRAAAEWDRRGGDVLMVTFTAPHDLRDALAPLFDTVAGTWRHILQSRAWRQLKADLGILGHIRAVEVTHGQNGWHPHLHVLLFIGSKVETSKVETTKPGAKRRTYRRTYETVAHRLDDAGRARLDAYLTRAWGDAIEAAGYRRPSDRHGVDVQRCVSAKEAGEYISKTQDGKRSTGNEIARADLKSGRKANRTPFEILDDFRWDGDAADLALWGEYERATENRRAITWSDGLRALLLPDDAEEQSDEEVAAEEVGGETLTLIPGPVWKRIISVPGLPCRTLEAAESGGLDAVNRLLARAGVLDDDLVPGDRDHATLTP